MNISRELKKLLDETPVLTPDDLEELGRAVQELGKELAAELKGHVFRQGTWKCGSCGENRGMLQDRCICGRQRGAVPWTS